MHHSSFDTGEPTYGDTLELDPGVKNFICYAKFVKLFVDAFTSRSFDRMFFPFISPPSKMQDKLIMLQIVSLLQVSNYKLQKEVGIINGSWWDLID